MINNDEDKAVIQNQLEREINWADSNNLYFKLESWKMTYFIAKRADHLQSEAGPEKPLHWKDWGILSVRQHNTNSHSDRKG